MSQNPLWTFFAIPWQRLKSYRRKNSRESSRMWALRDPFLQEVLRQGSSAMTARRLKWARRTWFPWTKKMKSMRCGKLVSGQLKGYVNLRESHWFDLIHWFEQADEDGTLTIQGLVFHAVHQVRQVRTFTECWAADIHSWTPGRLTTVAKRHGGSRERVYRPLRYIIWSGINR